MQALTDDTVWEQHCILEETHHICWVWKFTGVEIGCGYSWDLTYLVAFISDALICRPIRKGWRPHIHIPNFHSVPTTLGRSTSLVSKDPVPNWREESTVVAKIEGCVTGRWGPH